MISKLLLIYFPIVNSNSSALIFYILLNFGISLLEVLNCYLAASIYCDNCLNEYKWNKSIDYTCFYSEIINLRIVHCLLVQKILKAEKSNKGKTQR